MLTLINFPFDVKKIFNSVFTISEYLFFVSQDNRSFHETVLEGIMTEGIKQV